MYDLVEHCRVGRHSSAERDSEQAFLAFELGVEVLAHLADLAEDLGLRRARDGALRAEQLVREHSLNLANHVDKHVNYLD